MCSLLSPLGPNRLVPLKKDSHDFLILGRPGRTHLAQKGRVVRRFSLFAWHCQITCHADGGNKENKEVPLTENSLLWLTLHHNYTHQHTAPSPTPFFPPTPTCKNEKKKKSLEWECVQFLKGWGFLHLWNFCSWKINSTVIEIRRGGGRERE